MQSYRTELITDLQTLDAHEWQDLVSCNGYQPGQVFLNLNWLRGMQQTGCVDGPASNGTTTTGTGWQPEFIVLRSQSGQIEAACPLYRKFHSYGEYVFDWAWANAYEQHGLSYYPKLLSAIPFTPVRGQRLLARSPESRGQLIRAIQDHAMRTKASSIHVLLPHDDEQRALAAANLMTRKGVQFHWLNRGADGAPFASMENFLASLSQPKRKKIRAERRKVAEVGVQLQRLIGTDITPQDWSFFYRCYERTYLEHRSSPYLNEEFFQLVGQLMPSAFVMIKASYESTLIAASLLMRDEDRLYGRYWGALAHVPNLHFEACYYQAIEAAIDLGLDVVEGGAQGEHKMARGFLPTQTTSAHWLARPEFADAVQRFLEREGTAMDGYLDELNERLPFKAQRTDTV